MTADPLPSAGRTYLAGLGTLIGRVLDDEWPAISEAASAVAASVAGSGTIHVFGTGHSHVLAEEMFYRAGGLAQVNPILFEGLMLHAGAELGTKLERLERLAEVIWACQPASPGDVLIVASPSSRQ